MGAEKSVVESMTHSYASRPRRDALVDIRKQKGFPAALITAWGIIELNLDNVILREYNLSSQNPKADLLLRLSVSDKLDLQLKLGMLTTQEHEIVGAFRRRRHRLLHNQGVSVPTLSETENQEIFGEAIKAVDITHDLFDRVFDEKNNHKWTSPSLVK